MAIATTPSSIEELGEAAGVVWHTLHKHGPLTFAKLVKQTKLHRDVVMQAIGWLAREGKIEFDDNSRTKTVALRDDG